MTHDRLEEIREAVESHNRPLTARQYAVELLAEVDRMSGMLSQYERLLLKTEREMCKGCKARANLIQATK